MSLDTGTFETLVPSRFITFTFPNPTTNRHQLFTPLLRVAVLDSPTATDLPRVGAMIVPFERETDWIFSTEAGHLQLLLHSPQISRLILIGNLSDSLNPKPTYTQPLSIDSSQQSHIEESLAPLLIALSPKSAFGKGLPEIPFLTYEDDVIRSVIIERCVGSSVGEMLIEDVELERVNAEYDESSGRELRRRLRFKRMPNLIQTQLRIRESTINNPDTTVLVHPYLTPMVAGLSLIVSFLDQQIQCGFMPKALCLGVGGGALLSFLNAQLGFEVVGIEADEVVLRVAKKHFGLKEGKFVRVLIRDAIEYIDSKSVVDKFDVVMVDLDSSDAAMGISAPPLEFVKKSVLQSCKSALNEHGIVVINVIPPCKSFHELLISEFQEVYEDLYELDVGNGENFVLIATTSPVRDISNGSEDSFLMKLKMAIPGAYVNSIRKL